MLSSILQYISTTNTTQYHSEAIIKEIITLLFIIFNKNTTTNTTASSTTTIISMYIHIIHKISILIHYIINNIIQYTSSNSNNTVETLNYMRIMLNNMIQCIQIISENTNKLKYIINSSSSTSSSDSSIIELNTINYYYCIINYYNICIHTNTILYSVYKYNNEKLNKYIDYIYTTIYNNITILLPTIEIILYELNNNSNSVLQYNSNSSINNIKLNFIITSIYYIQKYCIHNTTTTNYNNMMIINNIKTKRNNLLYKWVILISEILFTILYKPHSSGGKNLVFAPYFAEQLLLFVCLYKNNSSASSGGSSNNSIKWIFNELAKVSNYVVVVIYIVFMLYMYI